MEDFYSSLLDQISEGVIRVDSGLNVIYSNQAAKWIERYLRSDSKQGRSAIEADSRDGEVTQLWQDSLCEVVKNRQPITFEIEQSIDGATNYYRIQAIPEYDNVQNDIFINCIINNITNQTQRDIHRLQLAIEKHRTDVLQSFSINMAHDIRTPCH